MGRVRRPLQERGERIRVIYHTHVDVGAYFSEEDKTQATWDDNPILPGIFYLVCGIRELKPDGAILAAFNEETRGFDEQVVERSGIGPPPGEA